MQSLENHFGSRLGYGEQIQNHRRPVFRSSGIFPVVKNKQYSSRIVFLGYWFLKRGIKEVGLLATLRNRSGNILTRNYSSIDTAKSFVIELSSMLHEINFSKSEFLGSIEFEIFSSRDMVYPYPAMVLNYYNQYFVTTVHTIERIYNDIEDLKENEDSKVPEAGFDIYSNEDIESFISAVNGSIQNNDLIIDYNVINHNSQSFSGNFSLGKIAPYETIHVKLNDHIPNLRKILDGKEGTISFTHNFEGIFPRFLAGNIQNSFPSVSFTHSYYDCTKCVKESDYWYRINEKYNDSSVSIPLFVNDNFFTDLVLYPNFSPSIFSISISFHDNMGNVIKEMPNFLEVNSNDQIFSKIKFKEIFKRYDIPSDTAKSAYITANWKDGRIPARLKFGLNVGISGKQSKLPCNICFASIAGNPNIETKPGSFHWGALLNIGNSVVAISNASPLKQYTRDANVTLTFFRESDSNFIERKITIPPFGQTIIETEKDSELKEFLQKKSGWVTIRADNPYVFGYYFDFHPSGSVAGDHVF